MGQRHTDLTLSDLSGQLYRIESWEDLVNGKVLLDSDGFGYFADPTHDMFSSIDLYPSMIGTESYSNEKQKWTHVVWFNEVLK